MARTQFFFFCHGMGGSGRVCFMSKFQQDFRDEFVKYWFMCTIHCAISIVETCCFKIEIDNIHMAITNKTNLELLNVTRHCNSCSTQSI